MILGALLLACLASQDFNLKAQALEQAGRFGEAVEVLDALPQDQTTCLQRATCLWSAGDLGGALRSAEDGLLLKGEGSPRRQLLWLAMELSLELGESELAMRKLLELEASIASGSDLSDADRELWSNGWGEGTGTVEARSRVAAAVQRLANAGAAELRARWACAIASMLAIGAMAIALRR